MIHKMMQKCFSGLLCLALMLSLLPLTSTTARGAEAEYYGRAQLAALPNATALLYAYDQIVAGVEATEEKISIYNGTDPLSKEELNTVMDAYIRDYTHHFWLDGSYSYSLNKDTCLTLLPKYLLTGGELTKARADFDAAARKILSGLKSGMSEWERELYLHDALAAKVTYIEGKHAHNAYGALVEGKAVCEGYAEALQYLLRQTGIQSFIALGSSLNPSTGKPENHAWNYVRIDGDFYHVDLTWNDQSSGLYHAYFNVNDRQIQEDHTLTPADYALPECTATKAMYFNGKDTYLKEYNAETLGRLLKENDLELHVYIPGNLQEFADWYADNILAIAGAADIRGTFTYGFRQLGRELVLILDSQCDHQDLVEIPALAATCQAEGHKAYYACSCGKFFEDAGASRQISDPEAWKNGDGKVARTAHSYGKNWLSDETGHWHACVCGAKADAADHADGNKDGACDACGHTVAVIPAPTEPKPTEPKPTEPKPTEPKPTEPKPTEPKPTEPKPTEPKPTEPPVTTPVATEPEITTPVATEPEETTPVPTEPEVTTPVATEPVATTPVVTEPQPTETQPAGTEPVVPETQPGTQPADTQPEPTETQPKPAEPPAGNSGVPIVWILLPAAAVVLLVVLAVLKKKPKA